MKRSRIRRGSRSVVASAACRRCGARSATGLRSSAPGRTGPRTSPSSAAHALCESPEPGRWRRGRRRRGGGLLGAGDLVDAVVHDDDARFFGARMAIVARQPSCIRSEPSPSSAITPRSRLRQRDAERDRQGEAHAAQHVEVLRPPAARPQIEIGVADAADDGLVVRELGDEPLGQLEAVHHLGVAAWALRASPCLFMP